MVFINNYFGFNKQQRNGLLVLLIISFALLIVRLLFPLFIVPGNIVIRDLPLIEQTIHSPVSALQKNELFVFDPNTVSISQLVRLGFSEKQAGSFIKLRSKGFVFRKKTDLKKVYSVTPEIYSSLEPYILIGNAESPGKNYSKQKTHQVIVQSGEQIELNSADSTTLVALNGIGPAYAKRIIKYRNMLGGFISVTQLHEVYGFTDELYGKIKDRFTVNTSLIKKIDLNKDDFKTVNKHPYLSYELTKSIFDWRRKTRINSTNLKDIVNDPALYTRLLPYIVQD